MSPTDPPLSPDLSGPVVDSPLFPDFDNRNRRQRSAAGASDWDAVLPPPTRVH